MNQPLTIKLGMILVVVLVLLVMIEMVSSTISDRQTFKAEATQNIARSWTGSQEMIGPILRIPYTVEWQVDRWTSEGEKLTQTKRNTQVAYLVPDTLLQSVNVTTEIRSKGIFDVPVYEATIKIEGIFDLDPSLVESYPDAKISYGNPTLGIGIQDARGISVAGNLHWRGTSTKLLAGSKLNYLPQGLHAPVAVNLNEDERVSFEVTLGVRGLESLMFQPAAKNFEMTMLADWPHPAFSGNFLPIKREVHSNGFSAKWSTNEFSSIVHKSATECATECLLDQSTSLGVNFIQPVDVYGKTQRSIKYAVLFVCLMFAAFFVFETLHKLPIHPIQYALVGLAITVFYLLLLSLTEHISFAFAYGLGAGACILLIGFYLKFVLASYWLAGGFTLWLLTIYSLLFVIISAEDFALLMGSGLLFCMLAALMITTRNVDWYQVEFAKPQVNTK